MSVYTFRLRQNGHQFTDDILWSIYINGCIWSKRSLKLVTYDNVLAPVNQAITWIKNCIIYWRTYALFDFNELMVVCVIFCTFPSLVPNSRGPKYVVPGCKSTFLAMNIYSSTRTAQIEWENLCRLVVCNTNPMYVHSRINKAICVQWPLLLTWFNFNPSMDK